MNINKRFKNEVTEHSVSELDSIPINKSSYELQNVLFNYCNVKLQNEYSKHKKGIDKLFGNIKKLPLKASLLQSYNDQGENKGSFMTNENSLTNKSRKRNQELVKVVGLEPEKLC